MSSLFWMWFPPTCQRFPFVSFVVLLPQKNEYFNRLFKNESPFDRYQYEEKFILAPQTTDIWLGYEEQWSFMIQIEETTQITVQYHCKMKLMHRNKFWCKHNSELWLKINKQTNSQTVSHQICNGCASLVTKNYLRGFCHGICHSHIVVNMMPLAKQTFW